MNSIVDQKEILRRHILSVRRQFEGHAKIKADKLLFQKITHHQLYQRAGSICTYVSMKDEADTRALIDNILNKKEKLLIIPKIEGGTICLYQIHSYDDMEKGVFGILEPKSNCIATDPSNVDLYIVPGVAFGRDGTRIGMGKGYYDRLLKNVHAPTIGLAYPFQLFDSVPTTIEDRNVDSVIF